jgi:DNA-binding XRE family transcriptional regulator
VTRSGGSDKDLLLRFLRLRKSRGWSQTLAASLVDVDQKAVSEWERKWEFEKKERAAGRPAPEWGVYGPAAERVRGFFARAEEYGMEVAELPPALIGEVNTVIALVQDSEVLAARLSVSEREGLMRQWLARHRGPIEAYIDRRITAWREAQDELARIEDVAHDRSQNGKRSGR